MFWSQSGENELSCRFGLAQEGFQCILEYGIWSMDQYSMGGGKGLWAYIPWVGAGGGVHAILYITVQTLHSSFLGPIFYGILMEIGMWIWYALLSNIPWYADVSWHVAIRSYIGPLCRF